MAAEIFAASRNQTPAKCARRLHPRAERSILPVNFCMKDSEFEFIRSLVYERSRINLTPDKRELVTARLSQRLRAYRLNSLGDYCRLLQAPNAGEELANLVDVISTNHTFFFRESVHFDILRDQVAPEMTERAGTEKWERFYVWSAASSSGEESYSIAMTEASMPCFLRLKSTMRIFCLCPPPMPRLVTRP